MTPSAQRAVEWLEQQVTELSGIRNATPRDPSFKNWRQASLTTLQRIWPGDQDRSERFRRIPFSPVDPRADVRTIREWYSRGCQEATRVLNSFIEDVRQNGVPDQAVEAVVAEVGSDFEDDFPTVDLPAGNLSDVANEPPAPANSMAEFVDDVPSDATAGTPAPPSLPSEIPAINNAAPEVHASDSRIPRKGVGARLKDLLGFAQLSAKALAGFPRETPRGTTIPSLPSLDAPVSKSLPSMDVVPLGDAVSNEKGRAAAPTGPPRLPGSAEEKLAHAPPADASVPQAPPTLAISLPEHGVPQPSASNSGLWPLPRPVPEGATPVPNAPVAGPPPAPPAAAPPAPAAPPAHEPGMSVVMSRPTTLRAAIEKVSIESLLSDQFRDPSAPAAGTPAEPNAGPEALEQMVNDMLTAETAATPPAAPTTPLPPAVSPAAPSAPPPVASVPAAPSATAPDTPVIPLFEQVRTAPAPRPAVQAASAPSEPVAEVPVSPGPVSQHPGPQTPTPAFDVPADLDDLGIPEIEPIDDEDESLQAQDPPPSARGSRVVGVPPRRRSPRDEAPEGEEDTAVGKVDPDAFARATEDFMRSSPVLGATGRKVKRPNNEDTGFDDPDAIAVASMLQELGRLDVPAGRQPEVRARLLDLARRIEKGDLDWNSLRKAVWFAMEYPEIARRLMPVLLPWIDRAA